MKAAVSRGPVARARRARPQWKYVAPRLFSYVVVPIVTVNVSPVMVLFVGLLPIPSMP
jgi:hypothetical protein